MSIYTNLFLIILVIVNWLFTKNWLYPAFIQSSLWLFVVTSVNLLKNKYGELDDTTYMIILIGTIAFSFGNFLIAYRKKKLFTHVRVIGIPKESIVIVLIVLSSFIFPLFIYRAISLYKQVGGSGFFLKDLRFALTSDMASETGRYGILAYAVNLSNLTAASAVLRANYSHSKKSDRFRAWFACLLALGYAILSTGRTFILFFLAAAFGPIVALRKIHLSKIFVFGVIPFFSIYIAYSFLFAKGIANPKDIFDLFSQAFETITQYFVGGIYGFDQIIRGNLVIESNFGEYVFRFFYSILEKFGYNIKAQALIQPFIRYPFRTNIFTFYQPYYLDFDIFGTLIFQFLLGLLYGYFYRKITCRSVKTFDLCLYGLLFYPLIMQFFQDQYVSLTSTWIQLFFGNWLIYKYSLKNSK